jgi:hypothetical protein
MKQILKIAGIAIVLCTIILLIYKRSQSDKEVIIKVKASKLVSNANKETPQYRIELIGMISEKFAAVHKLCLISENGELRMEN